MRLPKAHSQFKKGHREHSPYEHFVGDFVRAQAEGKTLPLGGFRAPAKPNPGRDAPRALIFSPHPDDEVIIGGLPLRLMREAGFNVMNVAVTQGSNKARQAERWAELTACCNYIGFGLVQTRPNGLEGVNLKTRQNDPARWNDSVARVGEILKENSPRVIFFPHNRDWNSSHIGTHQLVVDALGIESWHSASTGSRASRGSSGFSRACGRSNARPPVHSGSGSGCCGAPGW